MSKFKFHPFTDNLIPFKKINFSFLQYMYMGNSTINDYVPFDINYKYDNVDRAFRAETKKCNESYSVNKQIKCDVYYFMKKTIEQKNLFAYETGRFIRVCMYRLRGNLSH